jgi:phosphate starvation-inducible PhoH-like protein
MCEVLRDRSNRLVVVRGPAGCGKSLLSLQEALLDLERKEVQKVVLVRPFVECDEQLGFLPGSLEEKMGPWRRSFEDAVGDAISPATWARWIDDGRIEQAALGMLRGRTFRHSWVIADEVQNATPKQVQMLVTRIGDGCRMVLLGDPSQSDLRKKSVHGLTDLWDRLERLRSCGELPTEIELVELGFEDIQRDPVVGFLEEVVYRSQLP